MSGSEPDANLPSDPEKGFNPPASQPSSSPEAPGQNQPAQNQPAQNQPGQNQPGQNQWGQNQPAQNQPPVYGSPDSAAPGSATPGYHPQGSGSQGYGSQGYNPQGYNPQGYGPQGSGPKGYGYAPQLPKPDNYLAWSILSLFFCCTPLSIVAVVYSAQVDSHYARGDLAAAVSASEKAKKWTIASAVAQVVLVVLGFVLFVGLAVLGAGMSSVVPEPSSF